jgi:ABC-2 type transport system permease protein
MTIILIFIATIIGLNCIPLLINRHLGKLETVISRVLLITTIIFGFLTILTFLDYRLKGINTNSIITLIFIVSCLFYFTLIKITWKKLIKSFLLLPMILLSINSLIFGETIYENKINDTYDIKTYIGGFLACGESIKITKTEFVVFDKTIYQKSSLCLKGIDKIESLEFNESRAEFLIYHDGEMDSENPYKYEIKNKNVW